jgi:hypothetical protein
MGLAKPTKTHGLTGTGPGPGLARQESPGRAQQTCFCGPNPDRWRVTQTRC